MTTGTSSQKPAAVNNFGAGIRFYLDDEIQKQSEQILKSFDNIKDGAGETQDALEESMRALEHINATMDSVHSTGSQIHAVGQQMVGSVHSWMMDLAMAGSELETTRRQYQLAFKDQEKANAALRGAQDVAAKTNLDTLGVLNQVVSYQRLGVDALKQYNGQWTENGKVVKGQIPALQLVADLINGSGQATENVYYQLRNALRGQARSFTALFDGVQTAQETNAYKTAKNSQERMDAISAVISRVYGGISKSTEDTFGFILANLDDVVKTLKSTIGEKIVPTLAPIVKTIFDFLDSFSRDTELINAIAEGFRQVALAVTEVMKTLVPVLNWVKDLIKQRPEVAKYAIMFVAIAGATNMMLGKFMMFTVEVGKFIQYGLPALRDGLKSIGSAMSSVGMKALPLIAGIAAIVGAAYLAYRAYEENFGGMRDFVDGLVFGFQVLIDIIRSWSHGTVEMSEETYNKLNDLGIAEWVIGLGGWIASAIDWTVKLGKAIWENIGYVWDPIKSVAYEVGSVFLEIFADIGQLIEDMFGQDIPSKLDGTEKSVDGVQSAMMKVEVFLNTIGDGIKWVLGIVREALVAVRPYLHVITDAMKWTWEYLKAGFQMLADIWQRYSPRIMAIFSSLKGSVLTLWGVLKPGINMILTGVGWIVEKFSQWFGMSQKNGEKTKGSLGGISTVIGIIGFTLKVVIGFIVKFFEVASWAIKGIVDAYKWFSDTVKAGFRWWVDNIWPIFEYLGRLAVRIFGIMKTNFMIIWNVAKMVWGYVKDGWHTVIEFIRNSFIFKWLSERWNHLKTTVVNVWESIKAKFIAVKNFIVSVWQTVTSTLKDAFLTAFKFIQDKLQWLWDKLMALKSAVGETLYQVKDALGMDTSKTTVAQQQQVTSAVQQVLKDNPGMSVSEAIQVASNKGNSATQTVPSGQMVSNTASGSAGVDVRGIVSGIGDRLDSAVGRIEKAQTSMISQMPAAVRTGITDGVEEGTNRGLK